MTTKTRKTIGVNPLDAVVPDLRDQNASATSQKNSNGPGVASQNQSATPTARKERLTIHLPIELIERLKNAVFWTPGLTLAEAGEQALGHFVDELEQERGTPFEPRASELRGGRPLKRS